jgi:hypothetical protein
MKKLRTIDYIALAIAIVANVWLAAVSPARETIDFLKSLAIFLLAYGGVVYAVRAFRSWAKAKDDLPTFTDEEWQLIDERTANHRGQ